MNIPIMNDTHAVIDTCDTSRSRPQSAKPGQNPPTMEVSANVGKNDVSSIDSNDESKSRTYRSTLTLICGNGQQNPDAHEPGTPMS